MFAKYFCNQIHSECILDIHNNVIDIVYILIRIYFKINFYENII